MSRIMDIDDLLNPTQAAALIGVTVETINNRVLYGWLDPVEIAGRKFYNKYDVLRSDKRGDRGAK